MAVQDRYFSADVLVYNLKQGSTVYDYAQLFRDSEVSLEVDTERSDAATDLTNSAILGFEYDVQKSRGWSVRLGAGVVGAIPAVQSERNFGWDATVVILATDIEFKFKMARATLSTDLMESRAVKDTVPTYSGGLDGWRYRRLHRRRLVLDGEAVIDGLPELFSYGIFPSTAGTPDIPWNTYVSYQLSGGGLNISGNGTVRSSSVDYATEAGSQRISIVSRGKPIITHDSGLTAKQDLIAHAFSGTITKVQISRPGGAAPGADLANPNAGSVFDGWAYFTEAAIDFPDSAALQNATLTGYGALSGTEILGAIARAH